MTALLSAAIYAVFFVYLSSALFYFWGARSGKERLTQAALALTVLGCILHFIALLLRTMLAERIPLTNGVEFLLTFTWATVLIYAVFAARNRLLTAGGIVMLISAVLISLVAFLMKPQLGAAAPLMPALQSPWLTVHVITAAVAYAAFTVAAGSAFIQICRSGSSIGDEQIYRLVGCGFALLSVSIVLGAIWAEQAWGRYWTWDPKETWALVTWIVYAIYLHLHRHREWRGSHARIMVIAGFILVLFTFFGVNYLLPGLHSYA